MKPINPEHVKEYLAWKRTAKADHLYVYEHKTWNQAEMDVKLGLKEAKPINIKTDIEVAKDADLEPTPESGHTEKPRG